MNDHIPDPTKMISDTPRMEAALFNAPDAGFANIWKVGCDIERELATAQDRIRLLVAERNTARLQADQKISLREEFRELLGTDEIEQGVVVVRGLQERIKMLEEDLMDANNKHAALVADVALYEDRGERIKRLEEALVWYETKVSDCNRQGPEGDAARDALAKDYGRKAKEAKP
jgi:hypothetical protein